MDGTNNGGLTHEEMMHLANINPQQGTSQVDVKGSANGQQPGNIDFSAQLAQQQKQHPQDIGMPGPASPSDTLMPTSEQTQGTTNSQRMDLERLEDTKPTLDPNKRTVVNNIQDTTKQTIQGTSNQGDTGDEPIIFKGQGVSLEDSNPGEEEVVDPVAHAEKYMADMATEIQDPNVQGIIKNMKDFVPQLSQSLGGTAELDEKYSAELAEKEKLAPIYQGTSVDTITTINEKGEEVKTERLVSKSAVYDTSSPIEELTEIGAKYREAVIHIDKFNKKEIEFTPEEKAKLSHSTKIVLEEIEEIDLRQVSRRKMSDDAVISTISPLRANTHNNTTVPLMSSGLVVGFDGCPPLEVMGLGIDENLPVHQRAQIYSDFLYKHVKSTSIGETISREEFDKISYNDMEMMFYAVVCATYPDMDYLPVICRSETCKGEKEYQHYYSTRSLLRVERLHEDALEAMSNLSNVATTLEARRSYVNSPAMQTKTFRLPESRAIVVISSTSIADFIKRMVVMQSLPQEYVFAGTSAIYTKQVLIPPAGTEDLKAIHISIEDTVPIVEFIQGLSSTDLSVIQEMIARIQENIIPEFGLFDLTCPHCGEHSEYRQLNPSELLFFRVEQEMNRPVEVKRSSDSSIK